MTQPNLASERTLREWRVKFAIERAKLARGETSPETLPVYDWQQAEADYEQQRDPLDPARGIIYALALGLALLLAAGGGVLVVHFIFNF